MSDLLQTAVDAHGGLERWNELASVQARLVQGGALWGLKGHEGLLDDVVVTANLHEERVSHSPFGAPDRHSAFAPPDRVAIEQDDGTVVDVLEQPRATFAGHTLETPWTQVQLAYFVGTAMWTYLTQPFTLTMEGFQTIELEPWDEPGQQLRRLRVTWPSYLATHSTVQTLYLTEDGLISRHDYDVEISGGLGGVHYVSDYFEVAGIKVPTKRRVFPRNADGSSATEPLVVSIDLSNIVFSEDKLLDDLGRPVGLAAHPRR
jgi:hypothetical protein